MLDEQVRLTDCRSSPVAFVGAQANMSPGAESIFGGPTEVDDDEEHCNLEGAVARKSSQRVSVKRWSQDLQDECRYNK